jgi:hypothetical protein
MVQARGAGAREGRSSARAGREGCGPLGGSSAPQRFPARGQGLHNGDRSQGWFTSRALLMTRG